MKIILGLGNIGDKYENTYHNMGFKVVDLIAKSKGVSFKKNKCSALVASFRFNDESVLLAKPTTYMNNSGMAAAALTAYYDVPPENMLVIVDDLDIDCGTIRCRNKGSGGTHNGMRDIVLRMGTEQFPRIRIGIGKKPPEIDLVSFVLSSVPPDKQLLIDTAMNQALQKVECFIQGNSIV